MVTSRAAALRVTPFEAAFLSFRNAARLLVGRMYGTKERVNATMTFAFLLMALGFALQQATQHPVFVCAA